MPHDINNMFGVLADPDMMGKLKYRGRSKQFEKDIAENMAHEDKSVCQLSEAEDIAKEIDAELQKLLLLETGDGVENPVGCITEENKAEEAVTCTPGISPSLAAPAPPFRQQYLDTPPRSPLSGKPSHRRRRDQEATGTSTSNEDEDCTHMPLSPSPKLTEQPRELFIFTNARLYSHARALFATTSQPNHPANLRWCQLASLLTSPPINCQVIPARNGGSSVTVIRPARRFTVEGEEGKEGKPQRKVLVEKRSVVLHRPHGGANAWVERHVLENMAGSLMGRFGWEKGDFVFEGE